MQSDTALTETGLARRVKQHVTSRVQHFFAVCTPGLEEYTQTEVAALPGVLSADIVEGGIEFSGPFELVYEANLRLRTSNRILMRIDSFIARSYPELFDKVSRIAWERYVGFGPAICVDVTSKKSRIHQEKNIAASVFESIASKLAPLGVHLKNRIDAPRCVFIRLFNDECTVSIDASGVGLHKRGYRTASAKAPLRETTAAALLLTADFSRFNTIADPCCGSGTFLIEAAQMLRNVLPGSERHFAFESWPSYGEATWKHLKKKSQSDTLQSAKVRLIAADAAAGAVTATTENARRAGVESDLVITKAECRQFNADNVYGAKGLLISNLPYGKRVETGEAIEEFYASFGKSLIKNCSGWHFGLLVPDDAGLIRGLGLPIKNSMRFLNGGIAVRFVTGRIS